MDFHLKGKVTDATSNPIPDIFVEAYDSDIGYDDYLGMTKTDVSGFFEISFSQESFKGFLERKPDIYFILRDGFRILQKTRIKNETKNGEFFNLTLSETEPNLDIYATSAQKGMTQFLEVGDAVDFSLADTQTLMTQMIRSISSWIFYTNPTIMAQYGYPGPQVPRYPKKQPNHKHTLPWNL
jgi:hypothetical protein